MANSILKNITWLGFGSAAVKPIWFFFITYVCYTSMGAAQYGVMTAALALMGITVSLGNLGISQYTIREVARKNTNASLYFSNLLPARITVGLICLVLGIALSFFIEGRQLEIEIYLFAGIFALCSGLLEYCRTFFRAFETLREEAISIVVEKLLLVITGTLILWTNPTAVGALQGLSAGMLIALLINLRKVTLQYAPFKFGSIDRRFIKRSIKKALPLGLASVFTLLYFKTDSIMIKSIQGDLITGQYGIAFRIVEALLLLPNVVVAVLLPRLSIFFVDGIDKRFHDLFKRSVFYLAIIGIVIALAITWSAAFIIDFMEEGQSARPATTSLQILVWMFPFAGINYLLATSLTAANDQVRIAWILGVTVILNVVLNLMLIPHYSLYGACIATLVTQMCLSVAMFIRYRQLLKNRLSPPN